MKKIFMFLCCILMTAPAFAARNCPTTEKLELQGNQKASSPEFVYTSSSVRDEVDACRKAYNKDKSEGKVCKISKEVYECDKEQACDNGTYLLGQAGWVNGQGASVAGKILECNTMTIKNSDRWAEYAYTSCPSNMDSSWVEIPIFNKTSMKCFKGTTTYDLDTHRYTGHDLRYNVPAYCCKNKSTTTDGGTVTPPVPDDSDKKDCENSGGDWNGYACECDREKKGLVPDGRNSSDPHLKCKCADSKAKYDKKQDKCVAPTPAQPTPSNGNNNGGGSQTQSGGNNGGNGTVVTPPAGGNGGVNIELQQYECPEPVNGYLYWRAQYKDCEDVIAGLNELEEYCKSGKPAKTGYESRIAGLEKLRDQCKEEAARNQRITRSTAIISDASKKLDDIMAGLKISVWKTAEGNFNTARLASDSVAGVVLGTAGGLITSHLVKKGQVKNGFEDIQCTVGGQKVADWGDEFTVGIR